MNQSDAQGASVNDSGLGKFKPLSDISYSKPFIDFSDPLQIAKLAAVAFAVFYAWRKFKK